MFDMQTVRLERSFALASAGSNIAAKMAMMAITTNSSIKVNPFERRARIERPGALALGNVFKLFCLLVIFVSQSLM
jgi:hypothetical protein